jgi:hypothetical protein
MGESVNFKWGPGTQVHNVDFKNSAQKPTSCVQTAGTVYAAPPPLPVAPLQNWAGSCKFDLPGTYSFVCDAHPAMTGTVLVTNPAGGTPTPTPTATPTPTPTPPPRDTTPAPKPVPWASLAPPSLKFGTVAKFAKGKLSMTAFCSQITTATVKLSVSDALASKLGLKNPVIAKDTADCNGHNRLVVALKPTNEAADAFAKYKKPVNATATLTTKGLVPNELTVTRKVKLAGKKGKA